MITANKNKYNKVKEINMVNFVLIVKFNIVIYCTIVLVDKNFVAQIVFQRIKIIHNV